MRETEIKSKSTVIDFYNFFRDICQEWAHREQANSKLGGLGIVVEIDESKFFKAKYNRGRMLNREYEWVFGLVERGTDRVRFFTVADRTADTLLPIIADNVHDGSIIISDGWRAYGGIRNLQNNYEHRWVNHKKYFVDPTDPRIHTQSVEATWRALKTNLRHLHGTSPELLPTYIFQYMFRRFHKNRKIFQCLLEEIRRQYPV